MQWACAVLYCHLWPVRLYHIFAHSLINGTIFGKSFGHKICVLIKCTILSEIFLSVRRIKQDPVVNLPISLCKLPIILVVF